MARNKAAKNRQTLTSILTHCGEDLISKATANTVNANSQVATFCHNCLRNLKKKKCPTLSISNGMQLDEIPEELSNVEDLEQQLFARTLIFLKIYPLPKSGMRGIRG